MTMQVGKNIGIETLKGLLSALLSASKLDANQDGNVSRGEVFAAISGFAPQLFLVPELTAEVRDLDEDEINQLIRFVGKNFPDYTNIKNDVEDFIRQVILILAEVQKAIQLFAIIRRNRLPEIEAGGSKVEGGATPERTVPSTATPPILGKPNPPGSASTANPSTPVKE